MDHNDAQRQTIYIQCQSIKEIRNLTFEAIAEGDKAWATARTMNSSDSTWDCIFNTSQPLVDSVDADITILSAKMSGIFVQKLAPAPSFVSICHDHPPSFLSPTRIPWSYFYPSDLLQGPLSEASDVRDDQRRALHTEAEFRKSIIAASGKISADWIRVETLNGEETCRWVAIFHRANTRREEGNARVATNEHQRAACIYEAMHHAMETGEYHVAPAGFDGLWTAQIMQE